MAHVRRSRSRRTRRALPLAFRIASIYAMLVAATLLVVSGLALQFTRGQVTGQVDNTLSAAVHSFQETVPQAVAKDVFAGAVEEEALHSEVTTWLKQEPISSGEGAYVVVGTKTLQAQEVNFHLLNAVGTAGLETILSSSGKWMTLSAANGASIRVLQVPIQNLAGMRLGTLVVAASQSAVINRSVTTLLKDIAVASAIGLIFATLLGLFAVRRTLRPLENMSREVETIEETDDLSKRLSGRGPRDEVGRLAEAFDGMLGRLQEAFMSQRRFLSDASHELRTPMTVVRGQLELLAMDVESLPGRRSMSIAIEELDRMGRIVEDLLLLARLDEGMVLAKETVEVELVVGEALLRGMMLGPNEVKIDVTPGLTAQADADRLLQVLTNLVTNAVKHGRNAPITVTARQEGEVVQIDVADKGPGISPDDIPHVFERLYRGSKARSENPGGAGLGLAIAASLVRAMDGTVSVASTMGAGTTFTVVLPAAARGTTDMRLPPRLRRRAPVEAR